MDMSAGKQSAPISKFATHMSTGHDHRHDVLRLDSAIQILLSALLESQKALVLAFLVEITEEELQRLKARLTALSVERYCELLQKLGARNSGGLSDRRLLRYMRFIVLPRWKTDATEWVEIPCSALENEWEVAEEPAVTEELEEDGPPNPTQQTISQLTRLPKEIYDMIVEKFYEATFILGRSKRSPCFLSAISTGKSTGQIAAYMNSYQIWHL